MVAAAATLEIVEPPTVSELYFWALQATFRDGAEADARTTAAQPQAVAATHQ